ncbi:MAG: hypothetical protein JWN41_1007 [Thermoleophilia bacterium]|nr:hypothetical protein [Thermoleophilia bacterium]
MTATYYLIPIAFIRSTGGAFKVLLAIDHENQPLFDGEPAVLITHRPGAQSHELRAEGAAALAPDALLAVTSAASLIAHAIDSAHDREGNFMADQLLGRRITLVAPRGIFAVDS